MNTYETRVKEIAKAMEAKGVYLTKFQCEICEKKLTNRQIDWCVRNQEKYNSKLLCRFCQLFEEKKER